ncbi:MAG: HAMP domain-containing sensor histidine kinase, partial [Cyanobacteria bacterium J06639_1]
FIGTVSHELRTPLTSLRLALQMMKVAPTVEKREQYRDLALRQCDRQIELVSDLLNLQRLQSDHYERTVEPIDLTAVFADLVREIRPTARQREQTIVTEIPDSLPPFCGDRVGLERIVRELLVNASKYSSPGSHIVLNLRVWQNSIIILVRNPGEILETELPKIFHKFYRIPHLDRWNRGGTGLGLALIHQLVGVMGGTVRAFNRDGWIHLEVQLPDALTVLPPDRAIEP